jgi:hypothetical protein
MLIPSQSPTNDSIESLNFTEGCAEIFVQEIAEWFVLDAKELVET